ncbi:MAG: hypothetical protein WAK31_20265 [Chthoniobacterales bacterium]
MRDISQIRGIKTEGISADLRTEIYISADYADYADFVFIVEAVREH